MTTEKIYLAEELAVIIPTKDRPEKMHNLLTSLAAQSMKCGRIIVVASGQSIKTLVESFSTSLTLEYYENETPGQIGQRNRGIQQLDSRTRLVATLDDDIILEPMAIEAMLRYWNQCSPETAGVGFNIINEPTHQHSWIRGLVGMSVSQAGRVLPSGCATSICNVTQSIKTQWLNGGATVWRQDILQQYPHRAIRSRWAVCEDLIFSYPIGIKHPLYICADAKVIHDHVMGPQVSGNIFRFQGRSIMLWRLFFVGLNSSLSKSAYFRTWFLLSFGWGIAALFTREKKRRLNWSLGLIQGGLIGLTALIKRKNLQSVLENQN